MQGVKFLGNIKRVGQIRCAEGELQPFLRRTKSERENIMSYFSLFHFVSVYHKIASSDTSHLEAHVGFFGLLIKGIFGPYVL